MRKLSYFRSYSVRARVAAGLFILGILSVGMTSQNAWWPWSVSADVRVAQAVVPTKGTGSTNSQSLPSESTTSSTQSGQIPDVTKDPAGTRNSSKIVPDAATTAKTDTTQSTCSGFDQFDLIKPDCTIGENLSNIYRKAIPLSFLMAFLVLVYTGYMYITSLGNADRVKTAAELLAGVVTGIALLLLIPLIIEALGLV